MDRSLKYVRQYVDAGLLTPAQDAKTLLPVAAAAKDWDLGRKLATAGLRERSQDVDLLWWKTQLDFMSGDYLAAINSADGVLRLQADHSQAQDLKKDAVQKLVEYTQKMLAETDGP